MFAFVTRFLAVWGLFVSGWFFSVALARSTPVSIPTNLQGLYRLDMVDAQPLSPIKATDPAISSDDIQVVITALGTLCVGELTLESPVLTGGLSARARWVLPESELSFELAFFEEGFTGIDVLSSGSTAGATDMTLAVDGTAVSVRGGQYGNAFVQVASDSVVAGSTTERDYSLTYTIRRR